MENKELNLCDLLKYCGNAVFYCPVWGDTNVLQIYPNKIRIAPTSGHNVSLDIDSNGKVDNNGEIMLFPSRDQRDWAKWAEENKKVTYEDIKVTYEDIMDEVDVWYKTELNVNSEKACDKLIAIAKLMNVQTYLEKGWQPVFHNFTDNWYILIDRTDNIAIELSAWQCGDIYFSTEENAQKAIDILGEETIRLALSTDW